MADEPAGPPRITVDGKVIEAKPGEMVIAAAERGGVYIPRFCWHPRMRPVGMCRMCLVEVKGPRGFALMPACYVPVADGQEIVTTSPKVKKAQDGVLEFLLINHPLDCPVCDRGGECPLQDQTFAFGPGESRFVEEKRHWAKPIPINPLVALDRERCIQCSRCTRFADEVAGDAMIDFIGRADGTEVNIFPERPFTSNFSGNIVQICPVGALTATPYRFKARPWDLDVVESTCTACAVGCRMALQSSQNRLIRHLGIDSEPVNHGWLCDKGRFGYELTDNPGRLRQPLVRRGDELVEVSWNEALDAAAQGLRRIIDGSGPEAIGVLGGAELANEDAYAWAKFAKGVIGTDNVDCQMGDGLPADVVLGLPRATIDEACAADAVILLGPDLKEELPVLYLRLREAAVDHGLKLIEISPQPTGLSRHADVRLQYRPGEVAAVARALAATRVPDDGAGGVSAGEIGAAAELLGAAGSVVVVLGRPSLAERAETVADAAGVLSNALPAATFLPALRRGNVHGALEMGLAPGVLPGRVSLDDGRAWFSRAWGQVPTTAGMGTGEVLQAALDKRIQALVLVGADPGADFPDRALARGALSGVGFSVVVDLFGDGQAFPDADVIFPAAGYGERPGTTTNLEGRVSRLGQKVTAPGTARPDWMIAADLAARLGADLGFSSLDDIAVEIERLAPSYAGVTPQLLARPGYRDGVVVPLDGSGPSETDRPTEAIEVAANKAHLGRTVLEDEPDADAPLQPRADAPISAVAATDPGAGPAPSGDRPPLLRFRPGPPSRPAPPVDAYSLRLVASRSLYDGGTLVQRSPSLAALAQAPCLRVNPADLGRLGLTTGERVRVTSSRTSLVLDASADSRVLRGSAVLAFNAPGEGAAELIDAGQPVTDVRIETMNQGRERSK
ncbi:MAG TPA: NADH-quinone oxidoreductase subunit NuoG [Acidimicrobiales bacterium]|nr:NADH-quinone oxidoreductase subunit NuoG [Acidimicrobiales bacterium]